jgi:hypothetical protein
MAAIQSNREFLAVAGFAARGTDGQFIYSHKMQTNER